jgi:hypothetical protein
VTTATRRPATAFCSVLARERGLDPIGLAFPGDYYLLVEAPLPWGYDVFATADLPQEVPELVEGLIRAGYPDRWVKLRPILIAPDPAYSVPGHRRVIYLRRPAASATDPFAPVPDDAPPFARFLKREWVVPEAEAGPLCSALFRDPDALPRFDRWLQDTAHVRDLLVCTHGAIDAACARFGAPLWRRLRRYADASGGTLRAWRCTHFGAHVCAPTLIDLPEGRYWGFIEEEETRLLAERRGDLARLRPCYRGWSGLRSPWLQVAEREAMLREGWPWFGYAQAGTVLAEGPIADGDESAPWAEVRLTFTDPDTGRGGAYEARVERIAPLVTLPTTGKDETYPYPQYRVARFARVGRAISKDRRS